MLDSPSFRAAIGVILGVLLLPHSVEARQARNHAAIAEFRVNHPCPSTGRYTGHCNGWIIDHRIALCVGGSDTADNMRWQTFDKSHLKDKWECRRDWRAKLAECEANGCYSP